MIWIARMLGADHIGLGKRVRGLGASGRHETVVPRNWRRPLDLSGSIGWEKP